jgi:hypothetical protein
MDRPRRAAHDRAMSRGRSLPSNTDMKHDDRESPAIIMLLCLLLLVIFIPLHPAFVSSIAVPLFVTMVVTAIIVLFRPCDPDRSVVVKMLLRLVAAAVLTAAGFVVWFIYEFTVHPPTD